MKMTSTTKNKEYRNQGSKVLHRWRVKSILIKDTIIVIFIAISPYIFYIYKSFPDTPVWETFLFTYESRYYDSVYIAMWTYMQKLVPFALLLIWFFTNKHWWYHIILVPIIMYAFQLFGTFSTETGVLDEVEIYYLFPIMMVIVPFVYWIRLRLFDKLVYGIDLKEIERELDEYKEKERAEKKKREEERKKRLSDIH